MYNAMLNITEEIEMPKNNKVTKHDGVIHKQRVPAKLRIGSRKGGRSAHAMTNEALLAVLKSKDQSKGHPAARTVLSQRGVTV